SVERSAGRAGRARDESPPIHRRTARGAASRAVSGAAASGPARARRRIDSLPRAADERAGRAAPTRATGRRILRFAPVLPGRPHARHRRTLEGPALRRQSRQAHMALGGHRPELPGGHARVPIDAVPTMASFGRDEVDVCIVGSGAGGGPLALELARAGARVVVLEKGPWYGKDDFDHDEIANMRSDKWVPRAADGPHGLPFRGDATARN